MKLVFFKLTTAFTLMAVTCGYSQKTTIPFNVDMNPARLQVKDSTLNVRIKGDTEP